MEKIPRNWLYILVALLLAIAAVLVGKSILSSKGDSGSTLTLAEKNRELQERDKQIQDLDDRVAQLQKNFDESSKRIEELQAKLDEATKSLSATGQQLKVTRQETKRLSSSRQPPRGEIAPRPAEPAPTVAARRPADPGTYEVIRPTPVLEGPSESSRKLSTISKGTRVNVVRSTGDWLEVRSKHGNPPGYIRRDDAMFIEKIN
jgi:TolA-binding protein